ncbi:hypothetical protein SCALM49S_10023 [Streptomyces californicus]
MLRDLAAALPEPDGGRAPRDDAGLRQRGTDRAPLSAAQRRVWIDEQLWPGTAAYTVPEASSYTARSTRPPGAPCTT